jgi:hypothetical protein
MLLLRIECSKVFCGMAIRMKMGEKQMKTDEKCFSSNFHQFSFIIAIPFAFWNGILNDKMP